MSLSDSWSARVSFEAHGALVDENGLEDGDIPEIVEDNMAPPLLEVCSRFNNCSIVLVVCSLLLFMLLVLVVVCFCCNSERRPPSLPPPPTAARCQRFDVTMLLLLLFVSFLSTTSPTFCAGGKGRLAARSERSPRPPFNCDALASTPKGMPYLRKTPNNSARSCGSYASKANTFSNTVIH